MEYIKLEEQVKTIDLRINSFIDRYCALLNIIEKNDGNLVNVPSIIKQVGKQLVPIKLAIMRLSLIEHKKDVKITIFEVSSFDTTSKLFCEKYEKIIADLTSLYSMKYEISTNKQKMVKIHKIH